MANNPLSAPPTTPPPATGRTVPELARLLRVGEDKVRAWIGRGELGAVNTSGARCGRPRYVVLPHHLAEFERRRRVGPPQPARRRRREKLIDFYPDDSGRAAAVGAEGGL